MNYLKIQLLRLMPTQTRQDGDVTITFKVLFKKIYITDQHILRRDVLHLNKRLKEKYMKKIA